MSSIDALMEIFECITCFIRRSKGEAQAMFLRHEGYLGALGAFLSYDKHGLTTLTSHQCVERFPMGAPYAGGEIHGPPIRDLNEKVHLSRLSDSSFNYVSLADMLAPSIFSFFGWCQLCN